MRKWILAAALLGISAPALAAQNAPPAGYKETQKECSACHMAFPSLLLPQRSWIRLLDNLPNHFGEDASLAEATRLRIKEYLSTHAGDVSPSRAGHRFVASIAQDQTPLRITEVPAWIRIHNEEVRPYAWSDPRVRSKANCGACHRGASSGSYDDD